MKSYIEYTTEDFIQDLDFQNWVLEEDAQVSNEWEEWCAENPQKQESINEAKKIVLGLKIKDIDIDEDIIQSNISKILSETQTKVIPFYAKSWIRIAASITVILGISILWLLKKPSLNDNTELANLEKQIIRNTEVKPLLVKLPDGSTVSLQKNSEIEFAQNFTGTLREVKLKGEGLFDVVKDPKKPFVVYAGNITTKVLGTSFIVKSFDNDQKATVNVIHGKVSVVVNKKKNDTKTKSNPLLDDVNEIILTPNQQAIFTKSDEKLEQTLSDKPIVIEQQALKQFAFEETSVVKIFDAIEVAYGVDLIFHRAKFKTCSITTTLNDETLYEKLDIICKSIGATYKVRGVKIKIEGEACQ